MSLTVLYGGELASSLTLPITPTQPQALDDFRDAMNKIFTATGLVDNTGSTIPAFYKIINAKIKREKSRKTKMLWNQLKLRRVLSCESGGYNINMAAKKMHKIITCKQGKTVILRYKRRTIFVNTDVRTRILKRAIDNFPQLW